MMDKDVFKYNFLSFFLENLNLITNDIDIFLEKF